MSETKPAIALITGAWHTPAHYSIIKAKLEAQGYEAFVPVLPSCGHRVDVTWKDDVSAIHAMVEPHMDNGKEFVIACHSYGGLPGCASTKGFTVAERAKEGKKGGFRAILFMAAFAVPTVGLDLLQTFGGKYPPWMTYEPPYSGHKTSKVTLDAKHAFYSDLPDEEAQSLFDALSVHAQDPFETPTDFVPSDLTIPRTFLVCEGDAAMPVAFQEALIASTPGMRTERCSAGHSPFISQPDRVIEVLKGL